MSEPTIEPVTDTLPLPHALLADDDDDLRTLLATSLRRVGFQVVEACDGQELVNLFSSLCVDVPVARMLVVSDIGMPVQNGLEATRLLRERAPDVPVILVTAFRDHATLQQAREVGATEVILKPVDRVALVRAALQAMETLAASV